MWKTDGLNTEVAFDLTPEEDEVSSPATLVNVNGMLYFLAKLNQYWSASHTVWRYAPEITVMGTSGNDTISIGNNDTSVWVTVNGSRNTYPISAVGEINVRGIGGNDTLLINGTDANEEVSLRANGSIQYLGSGFNIAATSIEKSRIRGNGGDDKGTFFDSSGNDRFEVRTAFAQMVGAGYRNRVEGFETVVGKATGGTDTALLFDSAGNNTFIGRKSESDLKGDGISFKAQNFEKVLAYAFWWNG